MQSITVRVSLALALVSLVGQPAYPAVSATEASVLGKSLTPFGAERTGNKDGSIPGWTGGDTQIPAGFKEGDRRPDPFKDEKKLFSITAQNVSQYADKLNEGAVALFKKYPDYRIDVYPTHRTATAPDWVIENTAKNALTAKLTGNCAGVTGAYGGTPFPVPKSGCEVLWNHLLRWRGTDVQEESNAYATSSDGSRVLLSSDRVKQKYLYYQRDGSAQTSDNFNLEILDQVKGPPLHAGEAVLGKSPYNFSARQNESWTYLPGQRRVRRLPVAAYDTPIPTASGLENFDEVYTFDGPPDRYDWKLVGKKELYVPYNNNGLLQPRKDSEVMDKRFMNPDHMRYELHRVWVVEGTLRTGERHVMHKRRLYIDEDSWVALLGDSWDASGQLWRTYWQTVYDSPDMPGLLPGAWGAYDLQSGAWIVNNIDNEQSRQIRVVSPWPADTFTPDSMAGEGVD